MATQDLNFFPAKAAGFDRFYDWFKLSMLGTISGIGAGTTDLTTYFKLAGRSGGQTAYGDTQAAGSLTIGSTANGTKGKILLGASSAYDEANVRLGIGTQAPSTDIHVSAAVNNISEARVANSTSGTASGARFRATADAASLVFTAFGTANTTSRFGVTIGKYCEVLAASGGNGLIVGVGDAKPIIFGTNVTERMRLDGSSACLGIKQTAPATALHIGTNSGLGAITIDEESSTPANPSSSNQLRIYVINDNIVFQWNDGGTVRYKYLGMSGTGVTWTHSTTAP